MDWESSNEFQETALQSGIAERQTKKTPLYFKAIDNPFSWQVSCSNLQSKVP